MKRIIIILALFFTFGVKLCCQTGVQVNLNVSWSANSDNDLAGYKLYYGTAPRSYDTTVDVGIDTTHKVTDVTINTYYFAVTAYDTAGNESYLSQEEFYAVTEEDFNIGDVTAPEIPGGIIINSEAIKNVNIIFQKD